MWLMCVSSLLDGLISVPQSLLQKAAVLCPISFSRFEFLNKWEGESDLILFAFDVTDLINFQRDTCLIYSLH